MSKEGQIVLPQFLDKYREHPLAKLGAKIIFSGADTFLAEDHDPEIKPFHGSKSCQFCKRFVSFNATQLQIKNKIIEKTGFEMLMSSDANLTNEYRNDYNAIKENIITKLNS